MVTIHGRNLQILATEMYKLRNGLAPKIMVDLFPLREINYNIRGCNVFKHVNTFYYGKETLSFRGPKTWSLVPAEIPQRSRSLRGKSKFGNQYDAHVAFVHPFIPGVCFI